MSKIRPFSKLKKIIDGLFEPSLKMGFCCISYPIRGQWANNCIPRFYIKLGRETIWDFPKDFVEIKKIGFYMWEVYNISELVREYIDTPVDALLNKKFINEEIRISTYAHKENIPDKLLINYNLTCLFIAADRRLGRDKLLAWAKEVNNPKVHLILLKRFGDAYSSQLSFKERAILGTELLAKQPPVTLEQARTQVLRLKEQRTEKTEKQK
jgi:hypothetical protein